jgi:hypothetical protein
MPSMGAAPPFANCKAIARKSMNRRGKKAPATSGEAQVSIEPTLGGQLHMLAIGGRDLMHIADGEKSCRPNRLYRNLRGGLVSLSVLETDCQQNRDWST